jgi:hypothetical protein
MDGMANYNQADFAAAGSHGILTCRLAASSTPARGPKLKPCFQPCVW